VFVMVEVRPCIGRPTKVSTLNEAENQWAQGGVVSCISYLKFIRMRRNTVGRNCGNIEVPKLKLRNFATRNAFSDIAIIFFFLKAIYFSISSYQKLTIEKQPHGGRRSSAPVAR